jgi:calcium-translocating P-type ATPase
MHKYPWHALSIPEVIRHFSSSREQGLDAHAAGIRLREYGGNVLTQKRRETLLDRIIRQLKSSIALVLIAAGLAALFLGEFIDAIVIVVALLVNVVIGLVQEGRAGSAFEKLAEGEETHALVLRDGKKLEINAAELVAGDIVFLNSGKRVPADVRLVEATDLGINEAALTGEWVPVPKTVEVLSENISPSQRRNMAFRGTTIVNGRGVGIVVATGDKTEVGQIAQELQTDIRVKTPLEKNMEAVARFLLAVVSVFAIAITALGVLRGEPLSEILLVAIAVAVAAIPEGLPAAVTVSLAIGMERILNFGGLVKNLLAAETLGTTTFVLTDKTGTLTKGRMALVGYAMLGERTKTVEASHTKELLQAAAYASDAVIDEESEEGSAVVHGRPIERAVVLSAMHAGIAPMADKQTLSIPFSSSRRFGGAIVHDENDMLYVSGAPETLLHTSVRIYDGVKERLMTPDDVRSFEGYLREYTQSGLRVIAVARRSLTKNEVSQIKGNIDSSAEELTFMGLLIFADQIREDVSEALDRICRAGARVVMVTGDNPNTALYVAKEVGFCGETEKAFTGNDIENMSDEELLHALNNHYVFARVLPKQKLRIARILRGAGEVVAMTGDGINDAPALQAATIGVAVGSGTDVAKEAADLILLDDSFSIITKTIEEGRRLRDNIKKAVTFLFSTSFGEVLLVGAALIAGLPLPLLPTQILWANIVGEGFMNFAFAFEPADKNTMQRSPKDSEIKHVLSGDVIRFILLTGLVTASLLLIVYFFLLSRNTPIEEIRTVLFVGVSFSAFFYAFSMKSFNRPLWKINIFSNTYLLLALFVSILILLAALNVPFFVFILSLAPLTSLEVAILAGLGFANLLVIEFFKWLLFHKPKLA